MANNRLNCYKGLLKQVSNKLHDCRKPMKTYLYLGLNDSLLIDMNEKRKLDNKFMTWRGRSFQIYKINKIDWLEIYFK